MAFDHGKKMIPCELTLFAGKTGTAIGKQEFSFTVSPRVQQNISTGRMARVVFKFQAEVQIAQRNPNSLSTPAAMNHLLAVWQQFQESGSGLRSQFLFENTLEFIGPRINLNTDHSMHHPGINTIQA